MGATTVTQWLGAFGPFVVAAVALGLALWGQDIHALAHRPNLSASLTMKSPDCHKMRWHDGRCDAFFCRLDIRNNGSQAKDVEVRLLNLRRRVGDRYELDHDFRGGLNLVWEYTHEVTLPQIDRNLSKHCDLLYVKHVRSLLLEFATNHVPNQIRPGVWPTKWPGGDYRVDLVVVAANARPRYVTLGVQFSGKWLPKEADMFSKGLTIQVVSQSRKPPPEPDEASGSLPMFRRPYSLRPGR